MTTTIAAPLTGTLPICDAHWVDSVTPYVVASPRSVTYPVIAPFTGEPCAHLPQSTPDDVSLAYRSARAVQPSWAALPLSSRADVLRRFHDLVLDHQTPLLDLIQTETGKARLHAFEEVAYLAHTARFYANRAARYLRHKDVGGLIPGTTRVCRINHPHGVVGVVTPWNYPLAIGFTDLLCALLAGNAVVHRPDPQASLTALYTRDLLAQAGLPPRVLAMVLGDGPTIGAAVLNQADYVCYIGSSNTGRVVAQAAAARLVGCSLELGGKNPMYVAGDAHLGHAVEAGIRSTFVSAGQVCVGLERIYVHEVVYDEFVCAFVQQTSQLRLGAEREFGIDMGSLGSQRHFDRVNQHVDDAVSRGATVLTGGRARPDLGPYFYEPTVLTDVNPSMLIHAHETFGPVVWVQRVADDDEAVAAANDSTYGLIASVWSEDQRRAAAIARQIRCGSVTINEGYPALLAAAGAPMGGTKLSGMGRRHGAEGLLRFTESQTIATQRLRGYGVPPGVSEERYAQIITGFLRAKRALRRR